MLRQACTYSSSPLEVSPQKSPTLNAQQGAFPCRFRTMSDRDCDESHGLLIKFRDSMYLHSIYMGLKHIKTYGVMEMLCGYWDP